MTITVDNLEDYGIGHNFTAAIYPQDIEYVVYGEALDGEMVETDPTVNGGATAWFKEPSYDRWWKVGPRGSND
mgnify:CR=1 FL=1|jgi:hypothetical protein